jgi:hypothetical protein
MRRRQAADWRFLVEVPNAYNPTVRTGGRVDVPWGRSWSLARDDARAVVEVEASAKALEAYAQGTLPKTGRIAIQTEGRSAIERYLGERKLPPRILITAAGVRKAH